MKTIRNFFSGLMKTPAFNELNGLKDIIVDTKEIQVCEKNQNILEVGVQMMNTGADFMFICEEEIPVSYITRRIIFAEVFRKEEGVEIHSTQVRHIARSFSEENCISIEELNPTILLKYFFKLKVENIIIHASNGEAILGVVNLWGLLENIVMEGTNFPCSKKEVKRIRDLFGKEVEKLENVEEEKKEVKSRGENVDENVEIEISP